MIKIEDFIKELNKFPKDACVTAYDYGVTIHSFNDKKEKIELGYITCPDIESLLVDNKALNETRTIVYNKNADNSTSRTTSSSSSSTN